MKRVILVEDDHWLAESYQHILERAGFSVQVTASGEHAIQLIEGELPDALVVDVLLDDSTVLPLLHELQSYEDTRRIPIVMCTALAHPLLTAESLHGYGVRVVLDKATLTPEQFVSTIEGVIA